MPETKRPLKVFLCHAHSDAAAVRALYLRLRREGVDVWLDKEKLLPGANWELEIRKAVREADVVVVCLSKQFNQAGFRQKEVRIALDAAMEQPEGEIFIIPARLEECDNLESLSKWHWVDLFEEDGYQKLIRALRARADRIGAILRIRRSGQTTPSRPKNNEAAKTIETPTSNTNIGDVVITDAQEKQGIEKAEYGAVEKEERLEAEKAIQQSLLHGAAEQDAQKRVEGEKTERLTHENLERHPAEKARKEETEHKTSTSEKVAQESATREIEQNNKQKQRVVPPEPRKTLPKPIRTVIFLLIGLAGIACIVSLTSFVVNWVASLATATASATLTASIPPPSTSTFEADLCASGEIEAQVEKVHRHMREFDDAATIASAATQAELNSQIAELQRIRREAEDELIPGCLTDLKTYQIEHMNTVITTLFEFKSASNPQAMDCTGIESTEEESFCGHITLAREQHDKYILELARLLGLTVVPATEVDTPSP